MRNDFKKALCMAALCAFLLSGCGKEEPLPSEIVVSTTDESDVVKPPFPVKIGEVEVESAVMRAVSLSPAVTEILCELGFKDRLVGVSDYCDYPEGLSLPKMGSTENPDIDGIIKLKPDAVFTLSMLAERDIYRLSREGIPVITPKAPTNLEEYAGLYRDISAAFFGNELSNPDKGERKCAETGKKARAALENAAKSAEKGSFVYITEKLTAAGADTFEGAVLSLSGENLVKSEGYSALGEDRELSPDIIYASDALSYEQLAAISPFDVMLYNGAKIIFLNSARFERPSARTAEVFSRGE